MTESEFCIYEGRTLPPESMNEEHIIPLALGGVNSLVIRSSKNFNSTVGADLEGKVAGELGMWQRTLAAAPFAPATTATSPRWDAHILLHCLGRARPFVAHAVGPGSLRMNPHDPESAARVGPDGQPDPSITEIEVGDAILQRLDRHLGLEHLDKEYRTRRGVDWNGLELKPE